MTETAHATKWQTLEAARRQLQAQIKAAMEHDNEGWFDLCERLRRGDDLVRQASELWSNAEPRLDVPITPRMVGKPLASPAPFSNEESAKSRGERLRSAWVNSMASQGNSLSRLRGALYRNAHGETLGIPYSRENAGRPGHWFLGLPGNKFDCAALLCETTKGEIKAICLPREFFAKHGSSFSTSRAWNQTKFNVIGRGNNMYLLVATGEIDVTNNINRTNNVL